MMAFSVAVSSASGSSAGLLLRDVLRRSASAAPPVSHAAAIRRAALPHNKSVGISVLSDSTRSRPDRNQTRTFSAAETATVNSTASSIAPSSIPNPIPSSIPNPTLVADNVLQSDIAVSTRSSSSIRQRIPPESAGAGIIKRPEKVTQWVEQVKEREEQVKDREIREEERKLWQDRELQEVERRAAEGFRGARYEIHSWRKIPRWERGRERKNGNLMLIDA
jgi:hypothetical protein